MRGMTTTEEGRMDAGERTGVLSIIMGGCVVVSGVWREKSGRRVVKVEVRFGMLSMEVFVWWKVTGCRFLKCTVQ